MEEVTMAVAEGLDIERRVERALEERMPEVDLLQLSVLPIQGGMLRLVIDHPAGVDHDVCAAVTKVLDDAGLLQDYGAEVWSPGPEPPLRTPEHFRRAVGRRVRVQTTGTVGGRRSFTGTLVDAGDTTLRLSLEDGGDVEVPYTEVRRAHAFEDEEAFG
jgi:ribosome maturation factor RimP